MARERTFEIVISSTDGGNPALQCRVSCEATNLNEAAGKALASKVARLCAMLWGEDQVHTTLSVVEREVDRHVVPWTLPGYGEPCEGRR